MAIRNILVFESGKRVSRKRKRRTRELVLGLVLGESPWGEVEAYVFDSTCTHKKQNGITSFQPVQASDVSAREYVEAKRERWAASQSENPE